MSDFKDIAKDLSSIVPDLYYDLISRVTPGIIILLVSVLLIAPESLSKLTGTMTFASATSFFLLATVVAYISATLCLPFGEAARFIYMPFVWRVVVFGDAVDVVRLEEEFGLPGLSRSWNSRRINYAYRVVHEKLRYGDDDRSVVLSKMQAEAAQSSVLLGFFVLLWLGMMAGRFIPHPNLLSVRNVTAFWIMGTGTVVSLLSAAFRQLRLWRKHLVRIHLRIHEPLTRAAQGNA